VVLSATTNCICHRDLVDFRWANSRGRVRNEIGEAMQKTTAVEPKETRASKIAHAEAASHL